MTTVKMPRQHNRRLREIQRGQDYWEDVKEVALTIGAMFFFVMCLWGATELYDWGCKIYVENIRLKQELHEEHTAFKAMFVQDALKKKRDEEEREQYIQELCRRDERGCRIMRTTWKGRI